MTDFSLDLNTDILAAALICVSADKSRYYLEGVCVEPAPLSLRVVATDGRVLFAARVEVELPCPAFIIPKQAMTSALKEHKKSVSITVSRAGDSWRIGNTIFEPIDGTFPNWTALLPLTSKQRGHACQFDPRYAAKLGNIADAVLDRGSVPCIHHNGGDPALVTFGGRRDLLAMISPYRIADAPDAASCSSLISLIGHA